MWGSFEPIQTENEALISTVKAQVEIISTQKKEIERQRLEMTPKEFPNLDAANSWWGIQPRKNMEVWDLDRCKQIQANAFKQGWTVAYTAVKNTASGQTEMWPSFAIGSTVYAIDPNVNIIRQVFPQSPLDAAVDTGFKLPWGK
jgi:hypothetical protein